MFPPGRARLATKPFPTGSLSDPMTMGTLEVKVAALAGRVGVEPVVTITSTFRCTSSVARAGRRSSFPSAYPAIIINTASLGNSQLWNSDQFPAPHYQGAYTIFNHAGGSGSAFGFLNVPDLPAGQGQGAQLFQAGLETTSDGWVKERFLWDVVSAGSDSHGTHYKIRNRHSGLLL